MCELIKVTPKFIPFNEGTRFPMHETQHVVQYNFEIGGLGLENPFVKAQGLVPKSHVVVTV